MKLLLLLFWVPINYASTLDYLKEINNNKQENLLETDKKIKILSKKLYFLSCPIELIENQYNGIESVIKGMEIFGQLIKESQEIDPDYENIHDNCLDILDEYLRLEKLKETKRREINIDEYISLRDKELLKDITALKTIILENINQETLCYSRRITTSVHLLAGISFGIYKMDCYTPLGRRFTLKGPSLGAGFGLGLSLALPNYHKLNNTPTYRLYLYEHKKNDLWMMSNFSLTFARFFGAAIECDRLVQWPEPIMRMIYDLDLKPVLGMSTNIEQTFQVMRKKNKKAYFAKLIATDLFDDMAYTAL